MALVAAIGVVGLMGCGEASTGTAPASATVPVPVPVPSRCVYETPCVYMTPAVDPDRVKRGTEVTFSGRGWAPNSIVGAGYGSYCSPGDVCAGVGLSTSFRTDRRGRFTLRFRYDTREPTGGRGPVAAGSEEVRFGGRAPGGRSVSRRPAAVPPASSPAEREQAAGIARAVQGLARAVEANRARTNRASNVYQRDVQRCQTILRAEHTSRQDAVIERLVDASLDGATYGLDAPAFAAFARRLHELRVTDPGLVAGVRAWTAAIARPRFVPSAGLCRTLRSWASRRFSRASEPVAPHGTGLDEEVRASAAIRAASLRLRDLGASVDAQDLFAGDVLGLERYIVP